QTRRLLGLIVEMVDQECRAQHLPRAAYRFSRRAVREYTRWGDTQLKIHLARLTELEYLLVHRGGRGQSFEYELLFDGPAEGNTGNNVPHVRGLIDGEALRCEYDGERSGVKPVRSGSGRPAVGGRSAGGRDNKPHANAEKTSAPTHAALAEPKTQG